MNEPAASNPTDLRLGVVAIGRNEGERLRRCLASIPEGVPVAYVDSGSTDGSVGAASDAGAVTVELDLSVPFTAARARNAGAAALLRTHPDLEAVQFIDGDCELVDGWLDAAAAELASADDIAAVCGRRRERRRDETIYNTLCDLEWDGPAGDVRSCGGDVLIRRAAFEAVDGYDETLIAGEEPEMCVRMRREGWRIRRISLDMTLHDAAMTRFGQWWKRAVRAGYAYMEGRVRHGGPPERFRVHEVRSVVEWAVLLPALALALAWSTWGFSLLLFAGYGLLLHRVRAGRIAFGDNDADATLYARYCVLAKFAHFVGFARYWINRLRGRQGRIIEYKDETPAATGAVLYVGAVLPARSETFVYREFFGLRERGVRVTPATLRPAEHGLGDPRLDALATEATPIYGPGLPALLLDAASWTIRHPWRSAGVLGQAALDALTGDDLGSMTARAKTLVQATAALALSHRTRGATIAHVHAHMAHAPTSVAMYAARALGVTFSFTGHAADLFRDRALLEPKLRRAAFVSCISEWHRAFYQKIVARPAADYPVIRCGVDVDRFTASSRDPDGAVRLLAVGRLVPKKGFDRLIAALAALDDPGVTCEIIGDGPERGRLQAVIDEAGLEGGVRLLGARDNESIRLAMQACDLFVLPCQVASDGDRDGIPVVLMEAMACGAPVISGDLPTIRELVEDGVSGLMIPPGDVDGLAGSIRRLASDHDLRRTLAAGGRARVEAEFSLDVNVGRLIEALPDAVCPAADKPSSAARTGGTHRPAGAIGSAA